jgi:formylglycine-generating enzyme required for sulfatase activity
VLTQRALAIATLGLCTASACGIFSSGASNRAGASGAESSGPRWRSLRARDAGAPRDAGAVEARCPSGAVFVASGTFVMGSPEGEGAPDEHPSRQVTLRAFCIDRIEVTVGAYTGCVTSGACSRSTAALPQEDAPVSGVDWEQALSFCRFVGGRLPTEAEWEYAARGTDGRRFPWGQEPPTDCARADWTPTGTGQSCSGVGPSPAGLRSGSASPFGALDMSGNLWEWTADWYGPRYAAGVARNPTGPAEGSARVTRGGGWNNDQVERLRATWREGQHPAFRDFDLGVRCAYDAAL